MVPCATAIWTCTYEKSPIGVQISEQLFAAVIYVKGAQTRKWVQAGLPVFQVGNSNILKFASDWNVWNGFSYAKLIKITTKK